MDAEQILTSESYPTTLLQGLSGLYERHALVDCKLMFQDGESVMAHKCVLASASKYLHTQIEKGAVTSGTLHIKTVSSGDFLVLLDFMYTGQLKLSHSTVWAITSAAAILDMPDALRLCKDFVEIVGGLVSSSSKIGPDGDEGENELTSRILNIKEDVEDDNLDYLPVDDDDEYVPPPIKSGSVKKRKRGRPKKVVQENKEVTSTPKRRSGRKSTIETGFGTKVKLEVDEGDFGDSGLIDDPSPQVKNKRRSVLRKSSKKQDELNKKPKRRVQSAAPITQNPLDIPVPKYSCTLCPLKLFHHSSLQFHLKKHKIRPVLHRCEQQQTRKYRFISIKPWQNNSESKSYQCVTCSEVFHSRLKAQTHWAKTHIHSQYNHQCNKCTRTFANIKDLVVHKTMYHRRLITRRKVKQCHMCSRQFIFQKNMVNHLKTAHEGGDLSNCESGKKRYGLYHCNTCGMNLTPLKNYFKHVKLHEVSTSKKYLKYKHKKNVCKVSGCCKAFDSRYKLIKHVTEHTGRMPYQCPICEAGFPSKSHLTKHLSTHSAKQDFSCQVCSKKFSSHRLLNKHDCTEIIKCQICHVILKNKKGLRQHMAKHDPDRFKSCLNCGREFRWRSSFNLHRKKCHDNT